MNDLGKLQTTVWNRLNDATRNRDSAALPLLGRIADEMDRKYHEWQELLAAASIAGGVKTGAQAQSSASAVFGGPGNTATRREDFSGRPIRGFELAGQKVHIGSYKELLLEVSRILQRQDQAKFESIAPQIRGRGPYFSSQSTELRLPHKLDTGILFVETNLNANLIVEICERLAKAFGESLTLDVVPFRTRMQKGAGPSASHERP